MSSHLYKLKTLSVKEPWASLIFKYGKDVENRSWYSPYCGPLLIHASNKVDLERNNDASSNCYQDSWKDLVSELQYNGVSELPHSFAELDINPGHILGLVWLSACVKNSRSPWAFPNHYHWLLSDPILFKGSFPCRGRLGLFDTVIPMDDSDPKRAAAFAPYRCSSAAAANL